MKNTFGLPMLLYGIITAYYIKDAKRLQVLLYSIYIYCFFQKSNVLPILGYGVPVGSLTNVIFLLFSYLLNVIKILKYYSKCIFLNYTTAAVAIQKTCTVGNAN